ncbi:uncharacterized protein BDW43DRAFT_273802 [Aspergillus alliaceus]|nr:uncharacterized protein BDW43DRAFT_273802 [Aspergillus alliaceus]KAB8234307.1 hypothetical protein BDW43DRAFT_273802 [Aspergillus alliaceus]
MPCLVVTGLLGVSWPAMVFIYGPHATISHVMLVAYVVAQVLVFILNPENYYEFTRKSPDGSEVRVRRPLVGFKRCETLVGLTGGYEVRMDGWRYEPALVRI